MIVVVVLLLCGCCVMLRRMGSGRAFCAAAPTRAGCFALTTWCIGVALLLYAINMVVGIVAQVIAEQYVDMCWQALSSACARVWSTHNTFVAQHVHNCLYPA